MKVDRPPEFESQSMPFDEEEVYVFPTSFGQRRFWFLDQFEPGSPYYNIPMAIRVRGRFNVEVFKKVIDEIIDRHEILRTTFLPKNGEPLQIINPELKSEIPVVDLTRLEPDKKDKEIRRLATVEARTPFDLAKGPLFRVSILKAGENDHVLLITMHHIISDGWSIGVLVREITATYAAFIQGKPCPLPELPIQYADFAEWQREYLKDEVLQRQLNFWKEQLGDSPPLLELPTDRPRPQIQTNVGASERMIFSPELTNKIYALARREGATLFMVLLAGLKVLLARYSGQTDLTVGTPIANRNRAEIEPLIGLFINTLVLRTKLDDNPTFRELVRREKATTLAAYDHQDLPFEYLVDALQPSRDMSYPPLFQVMLILQNAPMQATQVGDLTFEQIDVDMGTSTHDLTFSITESSAGLSVDVEFNTDLFDRSTVQRLLRHYKQLFEVLTADADQPVLNVNFLSPLELKQILEDWNNTSVARDPNLCIHHLFEKRVEENPDAVAVVAPDASVTYGELNKNANQLARFLHEVGVKPETVVGVLLERQAHLLTAVLGVAKSGGAYLPLDPSYPRERLNYMLNDAQVPVLITQSSLKDSVTDFRGRVILIDEDWAEWESYPDTNPGFQVSAVNLVYMIYTSGSTGKAKGTMIQHGSLVNAYLAWEEAYELRTRARSHLQMASFSFDVFSGDWTRALCSGGKLVVTPREILLEAEQLYDLLRREQVTIAEFVPAVLRNLIQYLEQTNQKLDFFRNLIAGSDIWYVSEYKKFLSFTGPETRLINSFGLTEATIDSTYFESRELNLSGDRLVPIGKPFQNMTIYILDEFFQPVPIGVRGELYVGGLGVARGYFNRPDLTAERFLPDPFSKKPGERMYKTGDMARYLPDGNIEFLGRADDQVKLRGFRIELGEIETALNEHPDIQTAAVVLREDTPGDKKLIGYFVPQPDKNPGNKELRDFLLDRLPEYMVPSAFVRLDEMPLTPNGKVNRRALPRPDQKLLLEAIEQEYEPPRTPTEEVLAEIYGELLNVEKVGSNHNFFELGGHSLLATQLVSRIRENFNIDLPLRHIFEKPAVGSLAMAVDQLKLSSAGIKIPPIVPVSRDKELPLSFAQQRLWFLAQLEPESPFYNLPEIYRISGPLKPDVLEKSFNEVVKRHEALRTTFQNRNGEPVQTIHEPFEVRIPVTNLTALSPQEREDEISRIVSDRAWQPISIEELPLFRAELLKTGINEHIIILIMHHIIGDNWSTGILLRELALTYDAFSRNDISPLPPLQIQYADFAYWQRNWLQGEVLEKEISFWKEQLADAPPVLKLPTDRPRPAMQTFNGSYKTFQLSPEISRGLKNLAKKAGATDFMTLLAAFQTMLYRYSGQDDILIGTPIANRNHPEIEGLIGFFVNTLVIRTRFDENPSFVQLLKQVRETSLAAYAHQDLPFEKLVDALQPERNMSHSPVFQVMFALQNEGRSSLHPAHSDLRLTPVEAHSKTSKFDMTLFMLEEDDHFSGALEFNTDLFDEDTIERFIQHFTNLLSKIVQQPDLPLGRINYLSEQEIHCLLEAWNGKEALPVLTGTVVDMFERQVKQTPDAVALEINGESWTYRELNQRANQLAHYLIRKGVNPDDLIGIAIERSPQMIMAILGILKAGGAYVPLDSNYPPERLQYMIEDSGVRFILSTESSADLLPENRCETLKVDTDWLAISTQPATDPNRFIDPMQLCYVIYTSGSTGRPKGTLIHHQGLANYLNWAVRAYPVSEGIGSLVHSTLAFDATVTAVYTPLITGKTVYLLPDNADIDALGKALLSYRNFSLIKITPAHLELLSQQIPPSEAAGLTRAFVIGGENLTADQIAFWQDHAPETLLFNEYGPTETVVGCVVFEACKWRGNGSVPIGRAIPNMRVYALDAELQPVPAGVPGELYIGGLGVARGYLNRPDLTAERFIPDPFAKKAGERLYKTGDLVRYLKDGQMEFMGRIDTQVKIRGYRIELGEIENVIREFPEVDEAVVIVRGDIPGDLRLAAYLVPKNKEEFDQSALRDHLKQHLPDYMIPGWFVILEKLPLTPNGKVDRKALPKPDYANIERENEFVAPRTAEEEILANIWSGILHIDEIGVHDNFFELGGHSLLATQLISRIRDAFGVELPLKDLFEAPTVASLILKIEQARLQSDGLEIPPLRKFPREGELPLSFAQQRLWFLDQLSPDSPFYNIPAAVRVKGDLNIEALEKSLQEIIRRHEILRTVFINRDGEPVQVIFEERNFRLPVTDLRKTPDQSDKIRDILNEDTMTPFKLDEWPLFRCKLIKLSDREHIFIFTMHHIISDGWSTGVFMKEMGILYEAFSKGLPSPLPELRIQYADFAAWQRSWLKDQVLEKQLDYWRQKIGINPPVLNLPFDHPRPAVQTFNGDVVEGSLPGELTAQINDLARKYNVTPFMLLLAVFQTLLHHYSNQDEILVGSPIANRNQTATEDLIGFFVNTLILRADFNLVSTFEELLKQIRENTLGAYAHQDLPFEQLVEALNPDRDLSHSPVFQVMFVLQNTPRGGNEMAFPSIRLEVLEAEERAAKFDLTLIMMESDEGYFYEFEYNTDLFEKPTVLRMARHFETLMRTLVQKPQQAIARAELVNEEEKQQLLYDWNRTSSPLPETQVIHLLFEERVRETPDNIAVVYNNQKLTFDQLNKKANRLARFLRKSGVKPETAVAISVERSPEMVIGLLGILKSGGVYLPVDPGYPQERIEYIVRDAGISVVLTQESLKDMFAGYDVKVLTFEALDLALADESPENPENKTLPENLAYIIYTSGSTGRPKGTMLAHKGLVNLTIEQIKDFALDPQCRVLQFASFSFDASVSEIFTTLISGASLYLADREAILDIVTLINRYQITTITLPPSVSAVIDPEQTPSLKTLISAGEACSVQLARKWYKRVRLLNAYGPTENTVCATRYFVKSEPSGTTVPIGRPIGNVQTYILNKEMTVIPVGVPGELFIGGISLARGYLNRPELTAERFVPNPFGAEPGERLYKTGDLARYLPDGTIEFLGRIDFQVKVRGFRIELEEIENVLNDHPEVENSVVIVREDNPGQKYLAAYCVTKKESAITDSELKAHASEYLPDYMVPQTFTVLDAFPLTPNGKIDRRALPRPDLQQAGKREFVEAKTDSQKKLAAVWQDLLKIEKVGIYDNFFEIGGHSLLATQLVSRIRKEFDAEIPLAALFSEPTIAGLEKTLNRFTGTAAGLSLPPIEPGDRSGLLPLSYAQQRLWFLDQLEPDSPFYNLPSAVRIRGSLDIAALTKAFQKIIERHEVLRTVFVTEEGKGWQKILPSVDFEIKQIDLRSEPENKRMDAAQKYLIRESQKPFRLNQAPLMRVTLLHLNEQDYALILVMHHIISDGWSMNILINELIALYYGAVKNLPLPLPKLKIQYGDFSAWQRKFLSGDTLNRMLAYWKQKLSGAPELINLPTDRPRPDVQTFNGNTISFSLSPELSARLKELGSKYDATLYMTLLAVFKVFLYKKAGQNDISVGTPIANRNRAEIEPLIGFFVNTLVMRSFPDDDLTFEQFLRQIKQTAVEAYDHQDVPFEMVVDAVQPERALNHSPLFQVVFTLQNAPESDGMQSDDLKFEPFEAETGIAKFDLTLSMIDGGDRLQGSVEFNTDLFDDETIESFVNQFEYLTTQIVERPEEIIGKLPLKTQTEPPKPEAAEIPESDAKNIFDYLKVCPEGGGVVEVGRAPFLTYSTLISEAGKIALFLKEQFNIDHSGAVAIAAKDPIRFLEALLAVWATGAAALPLPPHLTAEEMSALIKQAQIEHILTDFISDADFKDSDTNIIDVAELPQPESVDLPIFDGQPNKFALIIPLREKERIELLPVTHRLLMAQIRNTADIFELDSQSRFLSFSPFYRIEGILEMLASLVSGSLYFSLNAASLPSEEELLKFLDAEKITLLRTPESILRELSAPLPSFLRGIAFYTLHPDRTIKAVFPREVQFINTICLEELSGFVACSRFDRINEKTKFTFGTSLSQFQFLILDKALKPVPPDTVGDLYVASLFSDEPDYPNIGKTFAERFIPNPFKELSADRLLFTGIRGRFNKDGELEVVLPDDNHIIINGKPFSLERMRERLIRHPLIEDARIGKIHTPHGMKWTVTLLTRNEESWQELTEYLQNRIEFFNILPIRLAFTTQFDSELRLTSAESVSVGRKEAQTENEKILLKIWKNILNKDDIGIDDNFFELGGDSILTIQIISQASQHGLRITPKSFFENPTIEHLAKAATDLEAEQEILTGPVPLTPIQQSLFEQMGDKINRFNTSMMFELGLPLDIEILEQTVRQLIEHHPTLRLQFEKNEQGWFQSLASEKIDGFIDYHDLSGLRSIQRRKAIRQIAAETQESFNIRQAPLFRFVYMYGGSKASHRLLIVFHHLIFDGFSWRILIEDFMNIYQSLAQQKEPQLPPSFTPYTNWAKKLYEFARDEFVKSASGFWLNLTKQRYNTLKADNPKGENTFASSRHITLSLSAEETDLFVKHLPGKLRVSVDALFLSVLGKTLQTWQKGDRYLIELYSHGRHSPFETMDVSRTIGWFTIAYPFDLKIPQDADWVSFVRQIDRELKSVPLNGLSYGLLRYGATDPKLKEELSSVPQPQINFNYLGQFDQGMNVENAAELPFRMASESVGPEQHPDAVRPAQLYLVCIVSGGQLHIRWLYSKNVFKAKTVKKLAGYFEEQLKSIINALGQ